MIVSRASHSLAEIDVSGVNFSSLLARESYSLDFNFLGQRLEGSNQLTVTCWIEKTRRVESLLQLHNSRAGEGSLDSIKGSHTSNRSPVIVTAVFSSALRCAVFAL
jgi:hypothetical protein